MKLLLPLSFLFLCISISGFSQQGGFENWPDEHEYLRTSWQSDGFTVPWVNGFDQSRAYVDDAFSSSGSKSLRVLFPASGVGPSQSGAQAPLEVTPQDQYYVSYWLRFSDNFSWGGTSQGGKLPGLAGGGNCSGCELCDGTNGFSARLMWRPDGRAILYLYHMDKSQTCGDNLDLKDKDNNTIYFQKGQWYNIVERVKVNTGSNNDGEVEVWVNGDPALLVTGLKFVTNGDKVDNFYFSTFHGGSGSQWAPGVDCHIWFDDIVISTDPEDVFTYCDTYPNCTVTGASGTSESADVQVSPNPFENSVTVEFPEEGHFQIEVLSLTGEVVERAEGSGKHAEAGRYIKPGIYFLRIRAGEKTLFSKIVKN